MSEPRLILADLDAEAAWARAAGGVPGGRPTSQPVERRISALGSLLRVFAEPGDALWTPRAVDPARLVGPLPHPELLAGGPRPSARVELAWARTARGPSSSSPLDLDDPWTWPASPAAVAAAVNHRRWQLALMRRLEAALPGAAWVGSGRALAAHLGRGGAAAAPDGAWVVKAAYSAAGRLRLRGAGRLWEAERRRVDRLAAPLGGVLVEPWLPRSLDVGWVGVVSAGGRVRAVGRHRQQIDAGGRFAGLAIGDDGLSDAEARRLEDVAGAVGQALAARGYRGPFGVDGWRGRTVSGERLQLPGEVNARMTFGHVAHALRRRLAPGRAVALTFARVAPEGEALPLLAPAGDDPGAWLVVSGPR